MIDKNSLQPIKEEGREKFYSVLDFRKLLEPKKKSSLSLEIERAKLARAQRQKIEIEIAKTKNKLIETCEIEKEWTKILLACRSKLLAIPSRMAVELSGTQNKNEIEKRLRDVIEEALTELSKDDEVSSTDTKKNSDDEKDFEESKTT